MTILRNHGTDDEERLETRAQLLNSTDGYFAIEDPLIEGDHVAMPDPRGGTTLKIAAEVEQHPMPASRKSASDGSNGYAKMSWGQAQPVRQAPVRRLNLEQLHPEVISSASTLFADRQDDSAITEAMKSVERAPAAPQPSTEAAAARSSVSLPTR